MTLSKSGHAKNYARACKVCGAARYDLCNHALCEAHYLEYYRAASKRTYQRHRTAILARQRVRRDEQKGGAG